MNRASNEIWEGGKTMAQSQYSEYAAWLQKGGPEPIAPVRLVSDVSAGETAETELREGLIRLYGGMVLDEASENTIRLTICPKLGGEAYRVESAGNGISIAGGDSAGLLYGVLRLLLLLAAGEDFHNLQEEGEPAVSRRSINHWDNMDGSIERGYAGRSIFFRNGTLDYDPTRVRDYARLLASVGINVITLNNVNVTEEACRLIGADLLPKVARLADIFRIYHIRIALSVHFESPVILGEIPTSDPLDARVIQWWNERTREIYRWIPDFSGYLVKADSEFRGGPHALGRGQDEGANMLARALAPHGGVVYWRCFIYNCVQDWRDVVTDRPKAAYELFKALDGKFEPNVILQIKNGPSDFQVREPLSPLLCAMEHTREALELQITQEYTGQQIDLYNLAVQWQEVMESPVGENLRLQDIIGGKVDTMAAVSNVGDSFNWTGHTLAQLNLYAYGRLAWNPYLKADEITREWTRLTFGPNEEISEGVTDILLRSRYAYEKYSTPLGLGWMVNIENHYGPSPEGYEFMKWGTYHRADLYGIGVDRTSRGTGFTKQYPEALSRMYDNPATCPEELLLYFHRLPYSYRLKTGKTLLQHIYDTHFDGVEEVEDFIRQWDRLRPLLPESAYLSVRERFEMQLKNAKEWRDVINTYFHRKTGIPDERGRRIFA